MLVMKTCGFLHDVSPLRGRAFGVSEVRWAADPRRGRAGEGSAKKVRGVGMDSTEGGGGSWAFVYSLCPMGLEMAEEHQCVCGLLQTYPFSLYVNFVVRKDEAFRRSEEGGCRDQEPGRLGWRLYLLLREALVGSFAKFRNSLYNMRVCVFSKLKNKNN